MPTKEELTEQFYSYFRIPKPGTVPSAAPGTGAAERDSTLDPTHPQFLGGPQAPPIVAGNASGYGGGGDTITAVADPLEALVARLGPLPPRARAARMGPPSPLVPRYTVLYDTQRSRDAWKQTNDIRITGTITPVTAADTANVVSTTSSQAGQIANRLSQFPGAIALFLVLRHFSCAPVAVTATGEVSWYFEDIAQNTVPLCDIPASQSGTGSSLPTLIPTQITDSGFSVLGKIHVVGNTVASAAAYFYQLGFALAYQMPEPAMSGYQIDHAYGKHREKEETTLRNNS